ncbi:MAG: HlyD family secretion protein [Bacteroidales bacterium]|nr:HlyD family secretion protein [Bacteroidales bacterium]
MEKNQEKKESNKKVYIPLILVVVLILGGVVKWYIDYSRYITTDDAHVESENVSVSPKIQGRISAEFAQEGDSVKQGQLLVTLDSTDLLAQKGQAEAGKVQAEAAIAQAEAKYQFDQTNNKVLEIALTKAQDDFNRAKSQFKGDVITKEQFDHAKKTLETAQAQYDAAKSQINVSASQVKSAEAASKTAKAQVNVLETQLNNTKLYAPCDGIVAKRWLLRGDIAQPGQSIYTILNDSKLWVSIFLEETKLENVHNGQAALFTLDTYPDETFTGKIFTIGSSTAATFSLIPANNASGNFTKVTQRVQIKISIDGTKEGKKLSDYHIFSGMSAVVKIIR